MLLEQVITELSEQDGTGNREPNCLDIRKSVAELSDSKISGVECNGKTIARAMSRELNLHLESEREFFSRLHTRKDFADTNSECSSVGFPRACNISIPFDWEEKPGKPKNNLSMQEPAIALSLPPVRKSNLSNLHLENTNANAHSHWIANTPMPLSSRLRGILQPKSKLSGISTEEISTEDKFVWDGNLHYPEEFAWRSMRDASPASVFEGPDCSPSSSSSLLSYCSRRPFSSSSKRHDSVSALLANRLIPVAEILNAVPVDNSGSISQRIIPAPIMSKNIHGSNMIRVSTIGLTSSNGGDPQKLVRVQSFKNRNFLNTSSRGDPSMAVKSARKSCRSVSWGGMEYVSGEEFIQPTKVLEVEKKVKQEDCQPIHVDKKVSDNGSAAPSLFSTFVSDGVNASGSSTCLSSGTSGSSGSSDSYIKSAHFGRQPSVRSHPDGLQSTPGINRHSDKKKDFQNSVMEDNGRRTLIDSHRNMSQRVKVRIKRWPLFMQERMKITGCCSSSASNTINCCSSRTATHPINHNRHRDKRAYLSNHQRVQVEWRKLHENDAIQKMAQVEVITASQVFKQVK